MKKLLLILMLVVASVSFAQSASAGVSSAAPKKVVVCKFVTTPGGVNDHIVIVSQNALTGSGFNGTFPYAFGDKHVSVAIRYATKGEKSHDISASECPAASTLTPRTDNPSLPDTGGSTPWLLLLAMSMVAAGISVLMRSAPEKFGYMQATIGSFFRIRH